MRPLRGGWITCPGINGQDDGVYFFRKTLDLASSPARLVVRISADNRYELYVNGTRLLLGPSRGSETAWHFETLDLAPHLRAGLNVIAAQVWNYGHPPPLAQRTVRTAFYLSEESPSPDFSLCADATWRVHRSSAYSPIHDASEQLGGHYIVVPPGDEISGAAYPWGFETSSFDAGHWVAAEELSSTEAAAWTLVPREIPALEEHPLRFDRITRSEPGGLDPGFLRGTTPLVIAPHRRVVVLLDLGHLTNAYPVLTLGGGTGARVELIYNEALYREKRVKLHRDLTEGLHLFGLRDRFLPEGGAWRVYRPLWFRTFRYVQLEFVTGAEPLTVHDFHADYSAYPFELKARFDCGDPRVHQVWDVSWRTARLCAHETYMDCPYYEQAQYIGDTRIQALVSLHASGDDRLFRQALKQFHGSLNAEGLTASHWPSSSPGIIPPFSLLWIHMVHDFWMHREDDAFVGGFLDGIARVLAWFERHIDTSADMLGELPHWNFVDWAWPYRWEKNTGGIPAGAEPGQRHSSVVTLHYILALRAAAELFESFGRDEQAAHVRRLATRLSTGTRAACLDSATGFLADTPAREDYSQHAQILGVLTGCLDTSVMRAAWRNPALREPTLYFKFYAHRALQHAGLADLYLDSLQTWFKLLDWGFSTFPEKDELDTRSDCHAWSASPLYDLLTLVAGIRPTSPGFRTVMIAPANNGLPHLRAAFPHHRGELSIDLTFSAGRVTGHVTLPPGTTGAFRWQGKLLPLQAGSQTIDA